MATVKILDLPFISTLQPNTANTILVGVDIPSDDTGKITLTTLAAGLYSNNRLVVGNYATVYPNAITTFANTSNNYVQSIIENTDDDGTSDWVAQANVSTDTAYFVDVGFTGNNYNNTNPYNSLGTSISALDGYLYVQGLEGSKGGNLVVGTASSNTHINFIVGGVNQENVVAHMTTSGLFSPGIDSVIASNVSTLRGEVTSNVSTINGSITSNVSTINGSITANVATIDGSITSNVSTINGSITSNVATINGSITSNVNTINGSITANAASANSVINSRITANIATANLFTQSAFDKANNALANTTGTFAGDLTITGNTSINYQLHVHNSSMPGNTQYILVTGTAGDAISQPSNPGYTFHSAIDGGNRVAAEAYGSNATDYSAFIGRRARGTAGSPAAVQNGDILTRLGGNGYGATKFSQFSDARVEFVAIETHTDTSKGTQIQFWTTPAGSNVATQIGTMNGNTVTFTGTVNPAKGFIFTPNVLSTITTLDIDFSRDNLIKFDVNNNATITLSNFVYGKVIEVWITNSAAQNKTITHGCLANNSTAKSTSFTISAQACAYLRYFSIDGDQANTYVSINA